MAKKKGIKKWIKDTIAMATVAFSNVEKDMLGQKTTPITNDVNHVRRNTQGTLMDSLINGEITQEVMDLRWRTYLVTKAMAGLKVEFLGNDEYGNPIYRTKKINKGEHLGEVKTDSYDKYPVELLYTPKEITTNIKDMLGNKYISQFSEAKEVTEELSTKPIVVEELEQTKEENFLEDKTEINTSAGVGKITSHGEISATNFFATNKNEKPFIVTRKCFPKFSLEQYMTKLIVRTIDKETKLLEFYVSKYPLEEVKNSHLFVNEIKKAMENPMGKTTLELTEVEFITEDCVGADDFMKYKYEIVKFDKIIDFNGSYVIKFIAKVLIDGEDILEKYRQTDLDEKYEKKERRKNQFNK